MPGKRNHGIRPLLYNYADVEPRATFMNERKSVIITRFSASRVEGFVESETRKKRYHMVSIDLDGTRISGGTCTCESIPFYGTPCKHMLKLRNSAVRIGVISS